MITVKEVEGKKARIEKDMIYISLFLFMSVLAKKACLCKY